MDLPRKVAMVRMIYHVNMIDVINVGNQLGLIKDEKAEERNKHHVMTLINDVWPRIFGEAAVNKLFSKK